MHNVQSSLSEEEFFHYVENLKLWTIKFAIDDWHPSYVETQIFFVYLPSLRYTTIAALAPSSVKFGM